MCNAIRDGGRRCASHHQASLFMVDYVAAESGLQKEQVNFLFKNLRSEFRSLREPISDEAYQGFLQGARERLSRQRLHHGNRSKVISRLEAATDANNTLTEGNLEAMVRLSESAAATSQQINNAARTYARREGVTLAEAREKFWGIYQRTVPPRNIRGVSNRGMDYRTEAALAVFRNLRDEPERETEPRVEYHDTSSSLIPRVGYDPADGRLEFHMLRGRPRYFHSVSPEDAEEAISSPGRILQALEESPTHQYASYSEAEADGCRVRCENCGQFQAAAGHYCPALEREVSEVEEERPNARPLQSVIDNALRPSGGISAEQREAYNEFIAGSRAYIEDSPFSGNGTPVEVDGDSYSGSRSSAGNSAHAQYITVDADAVHGLLSPEVPVQRIWMGRRIAVAGSNGTRFNEATLPFLVKLDGGENRFSIERDSDTDPRCTCDNFQANGRCIHLYPRDANGRLNNYVTRDSASGVALLAEELSSRGLVQANGSWGEGGGHLSDSPSAEAAEYYLRRLAVENVGRSSLPAIPRQLNEAAASIGLREHLNVGVGIVRERAESAVQGYDLNSVSRERLLSDIVGSQQFEPGYSENVDEFLEDLRSVRAAGEPGRLSGSVTGGFLSSEGGRGARGFGIELEFEGANREDVERAMRRAGFNSRTASYSGSDYSIWQVKYDGSLNGGGEVVSPVLYDNEETWAQIDRLCEILREEGATTPGNAGAHVHIGSAGFDRESRRGVHVAYAAHQDVIYRLATNEERGRHRRHTYSQPFGTRESDEIYTLDSNHYNIGHDRYRPINQQGSHTIEFRDFDGTIDAAHIQANVMMAAAVMRSGAEGGAGRNASRYSSSDRSAQVQTVGQGSWRRQSLLSSVERGSDEYDVLDDLPVINALDSLFRTREERRHMLGHIIRSDWQAS